MTEPMPMPPPETANESVARPAKSKGEKLFDRITYVGIAGVGTLIATVPLAYELEKHPKLEPLFTKSVNFVERWMKKLPFETTRDSAKKVVSTTTLMQGGNLMLLPVGVMEYYKVPIVRGLNAMVKDPTPEAQIESSPKQTLSSLVKSRLLAWTVVFGSFIGVSKLYKNTLGTFENETGELLAGVLKRPTHRDRTILKDGKEIIEKVETRTYGYGKILALDIFATAAAATLLYIGGHFFARKQEQRKEEREHEKHEAHHVNAGLPLLRDGDVVQDTPGTNISGEKQHEGNAREPMMTPQL